MTADVVLPLRAMPNKPGCLVRCLALSACVVAGGVAPARADILDDLSRMRANPLSGLRNVTVSDQVNVGFPSAGRTQNVLTLSVTWPFRLGSSWDVTVYGYGEIISQSQTAPEEERVVGLGDTVVYALATRRKTGALYWGLGPVLQLPTATSDALGSRRASAGPALALFVQPLPWTAGALLSNAGRRADDGDAGRRARVDSQFTAEYFLSYNLPRGWFLQSNASVTADWDAALDDRWTVPLSAGFGKVFTLAGQSLSLSTLLLYNVKEPSFGPAWGASLSLQLLFP